METVIDTQKESITSWFENLIVTLRVHQLELETESAPPELKQFYQTMLQGNIEQILNFSREQSQQYFVSMIIWDYLRLLKSKDKIPNKLAFCHNNSEVLVWAEINDNDELHEKDLILAEAKVNAKYHQYGFDMTSMIVETTDYLSIPNHYNKFKE